jgi:DNA polymerase-3 subunit beta
MKFTANKNSLYEAVSSASKACALKSALNILDGVLLSLKENTLTVTGYDLEIGIKISITVEGHEDGNVVTDPRLLSEMVKKMPDDLINFELSKEKSTSIKITSGKSKLNLPCKLGEEFPSIIELKKETSFEINEKLLKEMLTKVGFAVSRSNQELECIKMEIENNLFFTVATDGNRLAAKHCNIENQDINFTIPEKAVASLIKSLSDDDDAKVNISVDKNQICVMKENYVLISRLLEGKFVNYKRIIDGEFPRALTIDVRELTLSMERCLLLMSDKLRMPVTASINDGFMKISCKTTIGAIDEEIPVSIKEGDFSDFEINFNPRFMFEALQKTNCEEVKIGFDGSLKPFKITPTEDNGEFIFIIVPIRSS